MVAAEAFDGQDRATGEQPDCCLNGVTSRGTHGHPARVEQLNRRSTRWAGDRLGMEPSVRRVRILSSARVAHDISGHASVGPIVRDPLNDAQARSAVGAIGERVSGTPLARIKNFSKALRASRRVRRNLRSCGSKYTLHDSKSVEVRRTRQRSHLDRLDVGEAWGFDPDHLNERVGHLGRAHDADQHALGVVGNVAFDTEIVRDSPNCRSESDTLHQTTNPDAESLGHRLMP